MSKTSSAWGRRRSLSSRPAYLNRWSSDSSCLSLSASSAPFSQALCCSSSRNWRSPLMLGLGGLAEMAPDDLRKLRGFSQDRLDCGLPVGVERRRFGADGGGDRFERR